MSKFGRRRPSVARDVTDLFEASSGTSFDPRHPPQHALSVATPKKSNSGDAVSDLRFWSTGGMFPQQILLAATEPLAVSGIELSALGAQHLTVHIYEDHHNNKEVAMSVAAFEPDAGSEGTLFERKNFDYPDRECSRIKIIIQRGSCEFAALSLIKIFGIPLGRGVGAPDRDRSEHRPLQRGHSF
jgi:hypothetical protein